VRSGRSSFYTTMLPSDRSFFRYDPGCLEAVDARGRAALRLMKRIDRHDAAALAIGVAEHRLVGDQDGNQRVIASVDEAALRLRLRPGMTIAHAQSLVPALQIHDAMPHEDEAALARLALWCTRYSPVVAADPPDGIFIDIAGSAHLFKGETALLQDLKNRMAASKIAARAVVADTPGCAWAVARFGKEEIVAPGRASELLGSLPVTIRQREKHALARLLGLFRGAFHKCLTRCCRGSLAAMCQPASFALAGFAFVVVSLPPVPLILARRAAIRSTTLSSRFGLTFGIVWPFCFLFNRSCSAAS
jgi:impB/mucB/samB family